jgi:hypothetical protein
VPTVSPYRLRRVKPDKSEMFYPLTENLEQAIQYACELWEWSYTKSTLYVQRVEDNRVRWEVQITSS